MKVKKNTGNLLGRTLDYTLAIFRFILKIHATLCMIKNLRSRVKFNLMDPDDEDDEMDDDLLIDSETLVVDLD